MGRRQKADPATVAALKTVHDRHGPAALAELIESRLDNLAGIYALTDHERAVHRMCRHQFGRYDPGSREQRAWLEHQAASSAVEVLAA